MSVRTRTCVLTGTTHGIGLQTAKLVAAQGHRLIMLNRDTQRAALVQDHIRKLTDNHQVFNHHCDLANLDSIRKCVDTIGSAHGTIDVLINNAATMSGKPELSADGFELTLAVNYLGPFLLTQLLVGALLKSPQGRIVNLASSIHFIGHLDPDDLGSTAGFKSMRAYASSKLANVMHTLQLAENYRTTKLTANCLHPGVVATNLLPLNRPLLRFAGKTVNKVMRAPEDSAKTTVYLAFAPELAASGKYFSVNKTIAEPSARARNRNAQEHLWEVSMRLVGLS